ncbi:RDD family protein [Actinomadura sp. KC06]|uniref:RDD family protein n=1 Tax=Actinomadura sp. KC06 TaxID=2530369 RepID=UPI00104317DB|nr:RDD family protein [Actinomadura sp. KC06]TDD32407.1 RDD family protein [Actinomadura sp. KC06]
MSEPPENPRPAGGDREPPEPQVDAAPETDAPAADTPTAAASSPASPETPPEGTPERPPPYQGTYGAQPGQAPPPPPAGHAPPAGQGLPAYPQQPGYGAPQPGYGPPQPGYGPPGQPHPGYGGPQDMLAGRGARLGAGILDGLLLSVLAVPAVLSSIRWDKMEESIESGEPIADPLDLYNIPRLLVGYVIVFLVGFAYYTIMHAKWGQTLGKKAVGIRLVKASDYSAVSWGQAIGRQAFVYAITLTTATLNLLNPAAGILGLAGLLDTAWILWDERRQALHDKVAKTVVVKAAPWMPNPYARK